MTRRRVALKAARRRAKRFPSERGHVYRLDPTCPREIKRLMQPAERWSVRPFNPNP